jgi:ABC-type Mn2+/Zn2+ transport system permease subunit/Mn-dependent DtxR family transcriptional regulator
MIASIFSPLSETFIQKALLGGSLVAIVCGVVGCLVVVRRMAFLGDALSHAMIAGVGAGYLFMKLVFGREAHAPAMLIGSLIAAGLTVGMIAFVSRVSRLKEDTVIGIMYCGVFAAGVVLVSVFRDHIHIDIVHFIMGDVLGVTDTDLWVAGTVGAAVLTVLTLFFRAFQFASFDPVAARAAGIPVALVDITLTLCVSLVVVSAVSMVGVILVVGLLITPAATAYLLCDRLDRMMGLAALFGVTSVAGGLALAMALDSAGGGAIMCFCTAQFLAVLALAPRYGLLAGWRRRRNMIPQQLFEDILGSVLRGKPPVAAEVVASHIHLHRGRLSRALASMKSDGLLLETPEGLSLTEEGFTQARRLQRAHRLWETYLARVGVPEQELHAKAHVLEHVHEEEAVDYIDDLLGHPERDPHGADIPEDFVHVEGGAPVPASFLREGRRATIVSAPSRTGLSTGQRIAMAPRRDDGKTWVAKREDGKEVLLDHATADAVMVQPDPESGLRRSVDPGAAKG